MLSSTFSGDPPPKFWIFLLKKKKPKKPKTHHKKTPESTWQLLILDAYSCRTVTLGSWKIGMGDDHLNFLRPESYSSAADWVQDLVWILRLKANTGR